jgi:hypothetical protein
MPFAARSPRGQALPLLLLAAMLGIAVVLESVLFERLLWASKLPLALLLGACWMRGRRRPRR